MNYECHITCNVSDAVKAQAIADLYGWKTSEIARDPVLGDKSHFYLTKHSNDLMELMEDLDDALYKLNQDEIKVKRKKIEAILIDVKY